MSEHQLTGEHKPAPASSGGGGLSGVAIRRPVFTTMMMVGLVVMGLFSFRRLPIDQFPAVDIPMVVVQTVYPGASPETIEREVTRRLEEAFNPIEGVDRITSTSLEGVSQVMVEFDLARDGDQAAQDIRTKIDLVRRELPQDIEPPVVQKWDPAAEPIMSLALSSATLDIASLTRIADEQVRRRARVRGRRRQRVDRGRPRARDPRLPPAVADDRAAACRRAEIMGALQRQNIEVPAGRLERGSREQLVRVTGRIDGSGRSSTRSSWPRATAARCVSARSRASRSAPRRSARSPTSNGQRAVAIDIMKVSGANTVAVADGVKEEIAEHRGGAAGRRRARCRASTTRWRSATRWRTSSSS